MLLNDRFSALIVVLQRGWRWLTEPASALTDVALRRRARLLASFLVITAGFYSLNTIYRLLVIPGYRVSDSGILLIFGFTALVYVLSRSKYYLVAGGLAALIVPVACFNDLFAGQGIENVESTLLALILGLLVSLVLLPAWGTVALGLVNLGGIFLLLMLKPELASDLSLIGRPLMLNLVAYVLTLLALYNRNQIERDRSRSLSLTNEELQQQTGQRQRAERLLHALNIAALAIQESKGPKDIFIAVGEAFKELGFVSTIFLLSGEDLRPAYFSYGGAAVRAVEQLLGIQAENFTLHVDRVDVMRRTIRNQETVFVADAFEPIQQLLTGPLQFLTQQVIHLLKVPRTINAPLVADGVVIGLLSVQSDDLRASDTSAVTAFANQMAMAWNKAILLDQLEMSLQEQVRIEEELRENETKYRSLFENSPEGIVVLGLSGMILDMNRAAAEMAGLEPAALIGESFLEIGILDEKEMPIYVEAFSKVISGEVLEHLVLAIHHPQSGPRWIEIYPTLLIQQGEVVALQLLTRDITDRRQAQAALELQNAMLTTQQEASRDAILMVDNQDRIISYNRRFIDLWTIPAEILDQELDYKLVEYVKEQVIDPSVFARRIEHLYAHPDEHSNDEILLKNGRIIDRYSAPMHGDDGQYFGRVWYFREITGRRRAAQALRESEERFRSIFENAVMGVYRSNPDGQILLGNPALVQMLGYSSFEELAQIDLAAAGYAADHSRQRFLDEIRAHGQVVGFETAWQRKDGSTLFVRENARALRDSGGNILYYEGTVEDISVRKKVEEERQSLIELQQTIVSLSTRFINLETHEIEAAIHQAMGEVSEFVGADTSSIWFFSEDKSTASKRFGWRRDHHAVNFEQTQSLPLDTLPWYSQKLLAAESVQIADVADLPDEARALKQLMQGVGIVSLLTVPLEREGDVIGDFTLTMQSEKRCWPHETIALMRLVGDIILNALERKRSEESIRSLNEELELRVADRTRQLEATNSELEAFAYSVSHDLRAPLRAIDGFSQALLEDYGGSFDAEGQEYLERVRAASQRMGQLIADLLKLSRLSRVELHKQPIEISQLVEDVIVELREEDPDRHVNCSIQPELIALGDDRLVRVVLTNLLGNAWKFTSKQPVAEIQFGRLDGTEQTFYIKDNGAGFDMAYADKLFATFQRLHSVDEFEGSGIGLATVQRIIHRHAGQIWAEGEVGQGAIFYFTLGGAHS